MLDTSIPPKVLLIEDDSVFRLLIKRLLGKDFDVCEADCLEAARRQLASQSFSCVLLDYRLPDGTGMHLLPELIMLDLPVAMMTAMGHERLATEAIEHGCQAYLVKDDLTRETLLDILADAMEDAPNQRQAIRERIVFPQIVQAASNQCRETTATIRGVLLKESGPGTNSDIDHLDRLSHLMEGVLIYARILSAGWIPESISLAHAIQEAIQGLDQTLVPISVARVSQVLPPLQSNAEAVKAIVRNLLDFATQKVRREQQTAVTLETKAFNLEAQVEIQAFHATAEVTAEDENRFVKLMHPELEVSRLLVEKLHGRLWYEEMIGGFRICFALPYQDSSESVENSDAT
ncbi:response regulator [Blastopirellula marina]|uniref:Response regulatory domain-containing protein n=1 Tax=Blastopirellula marina TaxID=124 RepID=A0A2S8GBB4_9BACT|nr:response regulator [Blastopirellula marina]PQO41745.1 hypothetical protein C5Y98_03225 [Blastopirellula marina]PTL46188.1 hypothetical protein C5Y97_03225 [Blastopirellula marina]